MDIIKNFGINPYLLGAQIINFLILFYLLKRFAFKPILELLDSRRKTVEKGLKEAEAGKQALERALQEETEILKRAHTEAQTILQDAKISAEQLAGDIKLQTKMQVDEMIKLAKEKSAREEKEMEKRIAKNAASLAVTITQEAIQGIFTEKEQQLVIDRLAKKIKLQTKHEVQ